MLTTDAIADQQYCPRKRFWSHEYQSCGLEAEKPLLKDAVDYAVRVGLTELYAGAGADRAATMAELKFSAKVTAGVQLPPGVDESYVIEEQSAFVNAIVRGYSHGSEMVRGKDIRELHLEPLDLNGIKIQAEPDAMIREGDQVTAIFWRLCAGSSDMDSYSERHRIVAGVLAAEQALGRPVECELHYIFKGNRRNGKQHSILIRSSMHGYGDAWKQFGVKKWIANLPRNVVKSQFKIVKREEDFSMIDMLSAHGKDEWREQVRAQEQRILETMNPPIMFDIGPVPSLPSVNLNASFPQYRHSCRFCSFTRICDSRIDRPEQGWGFKLKS